jgi:acyl CoA:acetate/3-ketoacid CoA transferase beta subunit
VVTDRAVLDFAGPGHSMRLRSVHPGVSVAEVRELTGFELAVTGEVPVTRAPTPGELALIRDRLDPGGLRERELA